MLLVRECGTTIAADLMAAFVGFEATMEFQRSSIRKIFVTRLAIMFGVMCNIMSGQKVFACIYVAEHLSHSYSEVSDSLPAWCEARCRLY